MRDIQNTQCLLNVEHLSGSCPHVTLQFADSKGDVGLGLVKEGLVMVEVRKEKQFQKVVRDLERGSPSWEQCSQMRDWGLYPEPVQKQGIHQPPVLLGKDNGFGFAGVFKKSN